MLLAVGRDDRDMRQKASLAVAACCALAFFVGPLRAAEPQTRGPSPAQAKAASRGMVFIPAGKVYIGARRSDMVHLLGQLNLPPARNLATLTAKVFGQVVVPAFYMDTKEVTNREYKKFVDAAGHAAPEGWAGGNYPAGGAERPVVNLTQADARAYCEWAGVRLPTVIEWERAARGDDYRLYPWGQDFDSKKCNTGESDGDYAMTVGTFPQGASPYGLLDMAGNVWEFTTDAGVAGEAATLVIIKGGSYKSVGRINALVHFDMQAPLDYKAEDLGFRCAMDP